MTVEPALVSDVVVDAPLLPLADRAVCDEREDRLEYGAYADALAALIDNEKTDTPLTIAISAPWGAGKTSLAEMVVQRLEQSREGARQHVTCWFHAWMHDDAGHLGAAFAADVARAAAKSRPPWLRLLQPLPTPMLSPQGRWIRRLIGIVSALAVAVALALLVPGARDVFVNDEVANKLKDAIGGRPGQVSVLLVGLLGLSGQLFAVGRATARFVDRPGAEASRGSMLEVKAQLGRIIAQATRQRSAIKVFGLVLRKYHPEKRRLVIFVDDLERCRPPRAVDVCEVASQLLDHRGVVTVLLGDMSVVARSAGQKYQALEHGPNESDGGEYGRLYLEKMVQIKFDLPPPRDDQIKAMLSGPVTDSGDRPRTPQPSEIESASPSQSDAPGLEVKGNSLGGLTGVISGIVAAATAVAVLAGAGGTFISIAIIAAVVAGAVSGIVATVQESLERRREAEVDSQIRKKLGEGMATPDDLEAEVSRSVSSEQHQRVVSQRLTQFVTDQGEWREEAEAEVMRFLPALPRSSKRMINHLRLLLAIAWGRRLVGGEPALRPGHIGRWVVLNERWPELARMAAEDPEALVPLEAAQDPGELADELTDADIHIAASEHPDLLRFLQRPNPLSQVAERLVYLQPA